MRRPSAGIQKAKISAQWDAGNHHRGCDLPGSNICRDAEEAVEEGININTKLGKGRN